MYMYMYIYIYNIYIYIQIYICIQISGTAVGTKFAPPYACVYMDRVEQDFFRYTRITTIVVI